MAVITRGSYPKGKWPGVRRWWGLEYKKREPVWSQVFESLDSDKEYEEDVEDVGFGMLSTKDEAGAISYDTAQQGAVSRYLNITYGLGYQVTMEELQDNQYEKLTFKRTSRLARSTAETEETVHANILNRAFNSTYTGGDGVELISTAHPTASGNQSNELTTAADLSEASIEDLCIQIAGMTDSRGLKNVNISPEQLIVPRELWFEANRIVKSVLQNDTANNAVNVIKMLNVFPKGILMWRYLTDADAWFIKTDCMEGLTHYNRMAWEFDRDSDFETKNFKASVVGRFSAGWTNWRSLAASPGA